MGQGLGAEFTHYPLPITHYPLPTNYWAKTFAAAAIPAPGVKFS